MSTSGRSYGWILGALWLLTALLYTAPWWLPHVAPVSIGVDVRMGPPEPFRAADLIPWVLLLAPLAGMIALTARWRRRRR